MKKYVWLAVGTAVALAAALLLRQGLSPKTESVELVTVESSSVRQTVECTGKVASADAAEVFVEVPCIAQTVFVSEGQYVEAGDVLFTVDKEATQQVLAQLGGAVSGSAPTQVTAPVSGSATAMPSAGFSPEKVTELLALAPEVTSLDIPVGDKGEDTIGTLLPAEEGYEPQAELIRRELKNLLDELMTQLSERQRTVLRLHFGMEDGVCRSLSEIAAVLEVSKERVRQIERQAMDILQKNGESLGLEDFLNE